MGVVGYKRPPITEAVLEFRAREAYTDDAIGKVVAKLQPEYPNIAEQTNVEVEIDSTGGAPIVRPQFEPNGFRLSSNDQADVVLLGKQVIATARLAPYPGWEAFIGRARKNWATWRRLNKANPITRMGLRYINRIDIPVEEGRLPIDKYIKVLPRNPLGAAWPASLSSYLVQFTTTTRDPNWSTTITSTPVKPAPLLDHVSILLDIDVFRAHEIPTTSNHIWDVVEAARALKNEIFELCVTDRARELFDK